MLSEFLASHCLKSRLKTFDRGPGQATTSHFMFRLATGMCIACLAFLIGAASGCAPGRESLHELEHVQPAHWPSDLSDAADKLRERMQSLTGPQQNGTSTEKPMLMQREVVDIIGWIPEIAADTELDEKNWSEIHSATEKIRQQLAQDNTSVTTASKQIEGLCELLRQKQQQLDTLKTAAN